MINIIHWACFSIGALIVTLGVVLALAVVILLLWQELDNRRYR